MALEPHGRASAEVSAPGRLAGHRRALGHALPDARAAARLAAVLIALMLAGWGAGELSQSLHAGDLATVRDVAAQRTGAETTIAHVLSRLGTGLLIGPLAVACCVVLYRSVGPGAALYVALTTAGAVAIFNVDKLLVARPRPPVEHLEAAAHFSFPSGHATTSAAFYLALAIAVMSLRPSPTWRGAALATGGLLILGIAASRVYLGVHYPTDVAGGVLLGAAWTASVTATCARRRRLAVGGRRMRWRSRVERPGH
jgi:membrane-associated phospholipid phosphatase